MVQKKIDSYSFKIIVLLIAGIILGSLALGAVVEKIPLLRAFDAFFYQKIHALYPTTWLHTIIWPFDNNFLSIGKPHPSFLIVLYGSFLIYLSIFKRSLLLPAVILLFIVTLIARITLYLDMTLVFRERPFFHLPPLVDEGTKESLKSWTSFPSGHTRDAAIYATIIATLLPKTGIFMVVFVVFIGFSRIFLGIHYPTDILAGMAIGYATAKTAQYIYKYAASFMGRKMENKGMLRVKKGAFIK